MNKQIVKSIILPKNGNSFKNITLAFEPYSLQGSNVPGENTWETFVQIPH